MGLFDRFLRASKKAVKVTADQIEVKGKVLPHLLNVRKKPSLKSRVVGRLRRGDIVNILNEHDEWYEILWGKESAYVYKKYILIIAYIKRGQVNAKILNVRSMPSLEGEVVGKLHQNDIVFIVEEMLDWYAIDYNGRVAYVAKQWIEAHDLPPIGGMQAIGEFFHQREDLLNYPLEPDKQVKVPDGPSNYRRAAISWNKYGGLMKRISLELGIEVEAAMSIICVEGGGDGFDENGRMIIRFENHVFWMFFGKFHPDVFNKHFTFNPRNRRFGHKWRPDEKEDWRDVHASQDAEWEAFNFARRLDETAAMKSISMGAPQVMGFNHKVIGYDTVQEMFSNFEKDIRYHLFALFDFTKAVPRRIAYLQKKDFYNFAREYNGEAAPKQYEQRLLEYYHIFKRIL